MSKVLIGSILISGLLISGFIFNRKENVTWLVQSIDTMKYSRDLSLNKLNDPSFNKVIDSQIADIKKTGATHVAIATPYDDQFLPMLKSWVEAARIHGLNVWFRGNFAGWEGWFGYESITGEQHLDKTKRFILNNAVLFADGDIFTACPECENGGPGDPRWTGDVTGFRNFLITQYRIARESFEQINKKVISNLFSMNYDVASLVMDKETTTALDGVVTIDHYVKDADLLVEDINNIRKKSGGQVMLGEFGAPIENIHGKMSQDDQADWIRTALDKLKTENVIIGINYWVNTGGSTGLWHDDGREKPAAGVIKTFYSGQ